MFVQCYFELWETKESFTISIKIYLVNFRKARNLFYFETEYYVLSMVEIYISLEDYFRIVFEL